MRKTYTLIIIGLLALLTVFSACQTDPPTPPAEETTLGQDTVGDTEMPTEAPTEAPTEPETESPYLIPDPTRIDLTTFTDALLKESFHRGTSAYPNLTEEGTYRAATLTQGSQE